MAFHPGSDGVKDRTMLNPQDAPANSLQRASLSHRIRPFGILLLSPLIIAITVAILLGLLGIFVAWLLIVTVLVSAIVLSDLARRAMRLLIRSQGRALQHRAAGYP